jgi:hypothetical protein
MAMAMAMATWAEFEADAPGLAQAGRRLLYQHGPGLGYLATVRADGAPRVHPVCPHIADGRLWVFVGHASPKRRDLRRDGRYALHAFPCPDVDDEFMVAGTAEPLEDADVEARVRADLPFSSQPDDRPFELRIERALLATYGPRPSWPPAYTRWPVSPGRTPS